MCGIMEIEAIERAKPRTGGEAFAILLAFALLLALLLAA